MSSLTVPNTAGSGGSTSGSVLYYGFYDTGNTYNSITFNNVGSGGEDIFGFDDFTIGNLSQVAPAPSPAPAVTPELSSLMLLGTGLTSLLGLRRLRHA